MVEEAIVDEGGVAGTRGMLVGMATELAAVGGSGSRTIDSGWGISGRLLLTSAEVPPAVVSFGGDCRPARLAAAVAAEVWRRTAGREGKRCGGFRARGLGSGVGILCSSSLDIFCTIERKVIGSEKHLKYNQKTQKHKNDEALH